MNEYLGGMGGGGVVSGTVGGAAAATLLPHTGPMQESLIFAAVFGITVFVVTTIRYRWRQSKNINEV